MSYLEGCVCPLVTSIKELRVKKGYIYVDLGSHSKVKLQDLNKIPSGEFSLCLLITTKSQDVINYPLIPSRMLFLQYLPSECRPSHTYSGICHLDQTAQVEDPTQPHVLGP